MCRLCRWIETWLCPHCAIRREAIAEKLRAWRYAQANDRNVIDRDPDRDALAEADNLWRRDPKAGLLRLRKLADLGSVWSMLLLGYAFASGTGTDPDEIQSERWYRLAFEGGCQRALLHLGRMYELRRDFA